MANGHLSTESVILGVGLLSLMGMGIMIGSTLSQSRPVDPPPPYMHPMTSLQHELGRIEEFERDGRRGRRVPTPQPRMSVAAAPGLSAVPSEPSFDSKLSRRSTVQRGLQRVIDSPDHLADFVSNGATMEEIVLAKRASSSEEQTPQQVLDELKRGNARFWMGLSNKPELNAMERRALIIAQTPKVCVLGCSDSRVPVEIVFDQGLGDMFVIRGAGNVADTSSQASIEYAVQHLLVKVLVVMGHEGCGAVKSACLPKEKIMKESDHLKDLLFSIKGGLDEDRVKCIQSPRARDREAVICNTVQQLKVLHENPVVQAKVHSGELLVVGAFYEITSGIVDFHTVTDGGILEML